MNLAVSLRRDLADRAQKFAQAEGLPHCLSCCESRSVCFSPYANGSRHGNFLQGSYKAIRANPEWLRRLTRFIRKADDPCLTLSGDVGWSLTPVHVPMLC
jgi:hypothetical protein